MIDSRFSPNLNTWYLVTFTFDGAINRIYINGAEKANNRAPHQSGVSSAFWIGTFNGAQELWVGAIDDVRVYDRALAANEVDSSSEWLHRDRRRDKPGSSADLGSRPDMLGCGLRPNPTYTCAVQAPQRCVGRRRGGHDDTDGAEGDAETPAGRRGGCPARRPGRAAACGRAGAGGGRARTMPCSQSFRPSRSC